MLHQIETQLALFPKKAICIYIKTCNANTILEFNPKKIPMGVTIHIYSRGNITNLPWDPHEWKWQQNGRIKLHSFFQYTNKVGYKVQLKTKSEPTILSMTLTNMDYNNKRQATFYTRLWHQWLPQKNSTFMWLTLTKDLLLGSWLEKLNLNP